MRVEKTKDPFTINDGRLVKHTTMGHIHEIMAMKAKPKSPPITKLNKHEYVLHETGEIKEYQHIENRLQSTDSLRKTFKRLRNLINTNFSGKSNELMFTLTYQENMTDPKRLYNDFKIFMIKLRRKYGKGIEYINVVEPQGRGAWHCHVLLRFDLHTKVFIPNKEIATMWGGGYVTVKSIRTDGVDNIGAYLSAYLGDIELTDESLNSLNDRERRQLNVKEVEIDGQKKKFIKGGRLHMYPPGMNIYRKSKGIEDPQIEWEPYQCAKEKIGDSTKATYHSTVSIYDDDEEIINSINYEFYNTKRS